MLSSAENSPWLPAALGSSERHVLDFLRTYRITDLRNYAGWLKQNGRYIADEQKDVWSSPSKMLQSPQGDCEDFAFLNYAVLKALGYEAFLVVLNMAEGSHVICAFRSDDRFFHLDCMNLTETDATSWPGYIVQLSEAYRFQKLMVWNTQDGRLTALIEMPGEGEGLRPTFR